MKVPGTNIEARFSEPPEKIELYAQVIEDYSEQN